MKDLQQLKLLQRQTFGGAWGYRDVDRWFPAIQFCKERGNSTCWALMGW